MHGRVDKSSFIVAINDELQHFLANSWLHIIHMLLESPIRPASEYNKMLSLEGFSCLEIQLKNFCGLQLPEANIITMKNDKLHCEPFVTLH